MVAVHRETGWASHKRQVQAGNSWEGAGEDSVRRHVAKDLMLKKSLRVIQVQAPMMQVEAEVK